MDAVATKTRISLKTILFPTDFTEPSRHAMPFALGLAKHFQSNVLITHVIPAELPMAVPFEPLPRDNTKFRENAEKQMSTFDKGDTLQGIEHKDLIVEGEVHEAVEELVKKNAVDLIVVGTHGREGLKKLVLGSIAEKIFRTADCPVLTVGPHVPSYATARDRFNHIMIATDFSPGSQKALAYAIAFAEENKAKLTLVNVIHNPSAVPLEFPDRLIAESQDRLKAFLPADAITWTKPEYVTEIGNPADDILATATHIGADLIVLGIHTASKLHSHVPWATAYRVVTEADCPVLTVRA